MNRLTIALVGDLKHGRTVHSLAKILCHYKEITLHYVAPIEELQMPDDVCDYVRKHSNFTQVRIRFRFYLIIAFQKKFTDLEAGIKGVDLIYMTRVQRERFSRLEDYEKVKGRFVLTPRLLNAARPPVEDDEHQMDMRRKFFTCLYFTCISLQHMPKPAQLLCILYRVLTK